MWGVLLQTGDEYVRRVQDAFGAQSNVCGRIWGKGYIAYRCRTCGMSPCSAICHECFENGPHRTHNFLMYRCACPCVKRIAFVQLLLASYTRIGFFVMEGNYEPLELTGRLSFGVPQFGQDWFQESVHCERTWFREYLACCRLRGDFSVCDPHADYGGR